MYPSSSDIIVLDSDMISHSFLLNFCRKEDVAVNTLFSFFCHYRFYYKIFFIFCTSIVYVLPSLLNFSYNSFIAMSKSLDIGFVVSMDNSFSFSYVFLSIAIPRTFLFFTATTIQPAFSLLYVYFIKKTLNQKIVYDIIE